MKKALLIALKDLKLAFRDRAGLLLTLAAPFFLILGLGFVTGRLSGAAGGIEGIRVVLVNRDGAQLGNALVSVFRSADLADLMAPTETDDPLLARQQVDEDQAVAAVIIPAGFTASIIPAAGATAVEALPVVSIEVYANPTSPTSAGVVEAIVARFIGQVEVGQTAGRVAVTQMLGRGLIGPQDAAKVGLQIAEQQVSSGQNAAPITVRTAVNEDTGIKFDPLAYMAPGMALMFLMFAAALGGRSLLIERTQGTLPRLLVSPTTTAQVLAGKTAGCYLTGVAQMLILIVSSALLYGLRWGGWPAVLALVLAAAAAATGWGMLITALARTPGQVMSAGSVVTLLFGILGGSFLNLDAMPVWFRAASKITPNAWGLDGFTTLSLGGGLADIGVPVAALVAMGLALFGIALIILTRRGIAEP